MAPRDGLSKDEAKQALKEGLKEWLDEKFAQFGKYAAGAIAAALLAGAVHLLLLMDGWQKSKGN